MMKMPKLGNAVSRQKQEASIREAQVKKNKDDVQILAAVAKAPHLFPGSVTDGVLDTVATMEENNLNLNEKVDIGGGIYITREQYLELLQVQKQQEIEKRQHHENTQSDETNQSRVPNMLQKLADLFARKSNKLNSKLDNNTQKLNTNTETIGSVEKTKLITLREIETKQNKILSYSEGVLNKRFQSQDEITLKYLKQNIPQIYANQDFVNFLQRYLDRLESGSEVKTNVAKILKDSKDSKDSKDGRDAIKARIDSLYGDGFRISQQRLLTMFISEQMQYLGKSILNMSKLDDLDSKVEISRRVGEDFGGSKTTEIPAWSDEEKGILISSGSIPRRLRRSFPYASLKLV